MVNVKDFRAAGDGVTAELLRQHGIAVFGESQLADLAEYLNREESP